MEDGMEYGIPFQGLDEFLFLTSTVSCVRDITIFITMQ